MWKAGHSWRAKAPVLVCFHSSNLLHHIYIYLTSNYLHIHIMSYLHYCTIPHDITSFVWRHWKVSIHEAQFLICSLADQVPISDGQIRVLAGDIHMFDVIIPISSQLGCIQIRIIQPEKPKFAGWAQEGQLQSRFQVGFFWSTDDYLFSHILDLQLKHWEIYLRYQIFNISSGYLIYNWSI